MMDIFIIVLLTLVTYSLVGTVAYFISKENETVAIAFGLGIIGLTICGIAKLVRGIANKFKYHVGKCSVFFDKKTGKRFKCKVKDANAVQWAYGYDYDLIRRYALRSDYADVPEFSREIIINARGEYKEANFNGLSTSICDRA